MLPTWPRRRGPLLPGRQQRGRAGRGRIAPGRADRVGWPGRRGVLPFFLFFKQKTAYEIGLGIPAEPLFRSPFSPLGPVDELHISQVRGSDNTLSTQLVE